MAIFKHLLLTNNNKYTKNNQASNIFSKYQKLDFLSLLIIFDS